jgi:steroid 5-alpha reductase family enzyme
MLGQLLLTSAAAATALILGVWLLSLRLRDASVIDVFWGLGFVAIASLCLGLGDAPPGRRFALAAMAGLWGLRLAVHIGRRNHGRPEDFRYAALRARDGPRFWLTSLYRIYLVQAALMWVVALPLTVGASHGATPADFGPLDILGAAVWAVGLGFEAIGDRQLARFKADPASAGHVMDRGLWAYTRHPNYFGDVLAWWGIGLVALGGGGPWRLLAGPAANTLILVRLTGKPLLEATIGERRPGYADYVARTSGFVPLPRRRG